MAKQRVVIVDMVTHDKGCASVVDSKKSTENINRAIEKLNQEGFQVSQIATIGGDDEFLQSVDKPVLHFTSAIALLAEQE